MNKLLSALIIVFTLQACGGGGSNEPEEEVVVIGDAFDKVRSMAKSQLAASNAPAVSIAIYKSGEVVFAEAYGTQSAHNSTAVDENTLFQLGSTTKMFTALATMQLVDNNSLTLESGLLESLPNMQISQEKREGWQDINIHHLLTHQGGFEDYVDWEDNTGDLMDIALSQFPQSYNQMNPAGKFWNYSNPNWSYLGAIVEEISNMSFQEAMKQSVFGPLGMSRSTMQASDVSIDGNFALGAGVILNNNLSVNGEADELDDIHKAVFGIPAGSYTWSTPTEMMKMAEFLMHGNSNVLNDQLRQQIVSRQVDMNIGRPLDYGYGLFISEGISTSSGWYPLEIWEHGGNTLAYTSMFWIIPGEDVAVSILSSGQNTDFSHTMMEAIKSVINLPAVTVTPVDPVATSLFEKHVGHYEGLDASADIFLEDDQLKISIPAFDASGTAYSPYLQPLAGTNFRATIEGDPLDITFIAEAEGENSTYIRNRGVVLIRDEEKRQESKTFNLNNQWSLVPNSIKNNF